MIRSFGNRETAIVYQQRFSKRLPKELHVATSSILDIVHDRRRLSVDMVLRLSRYFGTSERFWLNLQDEIDIRERRQSLAQDLETIHPIEHPAQGRARNDPVEIRAEPG